MSKVMQALNAGDLCEQGVSPEGGGQCLRLTTIKAVDNTERNGEGERGPHIVDWVA